MNRERGTGRTSRQLMAAPRGAVFVCATWRHRDYVRQLAAHLGRGDLIVITRHTVMETCAAHGWPQLVLDHSFGEVPNYRLRGYALDGIIQAKVRADLRVEGAAR